MHHPKQQPQWYFKNTFELDMVIKIHLINRNLSCNHARNKEISLNYEKILFYCSNCLIIIINFLRYNHSLIHLLLIKCEVKTPKYWKFIQNKFNWLMCVFLYLDYCIVKKRTSLNYLKELATNIMIMFN